MYRSGSTGCQQADRNHPTSTIAGKLAWILPWASGTCKQDQIILPHMNFSLQLQCLPAPVNLLTGKPIFKGKTNHKALERQLVTSAIFKASWQPSLDLETRPVCNETGLLAVTTCLSWDRVFLCSVMSSKTWPRYKTCLSWDRSACSNNLSVMRQGVTLFCHVKQGMTTLQDLSVMRQVCLQ